MIIGLKHYKCGLFAGGAIVASGDGEIVTQTLPPNDSDRDVVRMYTCDRCGTVILIMESSQE